jgi:putative transposase
MSLLPGPLHGVIPNARRHGLRLLVSPDTILRWQRDIIRRRWAARSMRGSRRSGAGRRHHRPRGTPARTAWA